MKIIFVTRELNGVMGGLERQILMIANGLKYKENEITIISLEKSSGKPFFSDFLSGINFKSIIAGNPS